MVGRILAALSHAYVGAMVAVGNHDEVPLLGRVRAYGNSVRSPERHAVGIQPLGVDIRVPAAIVDPGDDGPPVAVRYDLRCLLNTRRHADRSAASRPSGRIELPYHGHVHRDAVGEIPVRDRDNRVIDTGIPHAGLPREYAVGLGISGIADRVRERQTSGIFNPRFDDDGGLPPALRCR